jgi:hypothetical protein
MKQDAATPPLTWPQLVAIEPRLGPLLADARRLDPDDLRGYERLKRHLQQLAGWNSRQPELVGCYDQIHRIIFEGAAR